MKGMMLYITFIALFGVFTCNENQKGTASNLSSEVVEAVSYGLAKEMKVDDFYIQNSKDYKPPQYVEKLPPKQPISGGEAVTVDELPSPNDYYDGTKGLKYTYTVCNNYTTQPEVCMKSGSCGWCASSNTCIPGNNLGPLAPCLRGQFKFTSPNSEWNPLGSTNVNISRSNIMGAQLTTVVSRDSRDN